MKKNLTVLSSIACSTLILLVPIFALPHTDTRPGNGTTYGTTNIASIGGGAYKQAQVETSTGSNVELIAVSGNYYIANGALVGNPNDSNRWSNKAYASLTYSGAYTMRCYTRHTSKGTSNVAFDTEDIF